MGDSSSPKTTLTKQIEFYFGDSNMHKSTYMQSEVAKDPEGYVPIEVIKSFHLVQSFSIEQITEAAKLSPLLVLSEDEKKIKRKNPLPPRNISQEIRRTIYVNHISQADTRESLTEAFQPFGEITFISIPVHKGEGVREFDQGKNKGFAFIEYETEEAAQNALKNYQDPSGQIKIIPKQEWLAEVDKNARKKTREHNKKVKENNRAKKQNNISTEKSETMEVEANKNSSKNEELGLILYFSGGKSTDTKVALRKQFQDICRNGVAFFDYVDGADTGYIRLRTAQDVRFVIADLESKKLPSLSHISVRKLSPTEEQEYRSKIPEKKEKVKEEKKEETVETEKKESNEKKEKKAAKKDKKKEEKKEKKKEKGEKKKEKEEKKEEKEEKKDKKRKLETNSSSEDEEARQTKSRRFD